MTDLISIFFPKTVNLVKNCWVERWLKEEGGIDTERFLEVINKHTKRMRK